MEVHAHTHTPRKKWSHYFWEFLMLFLAVFCGFLAEYQLEHVIEHQREKQFMKSMAEDLEKDIQLLKDESQLVMEQFNGLDSIVQIINEGTLGKSEVRTMYNLQRKFLYPLTLELINRTEIQLKNAGGMRLIRNKQVSDSIINYWQLKERFNDTKEAINGHRIKAKDLSFTIFNNKYYSKDRMRFTFDDFNGEPELITKQLAVLTEFANRVSHTSELLLINYKQRRLHILLHGAARLIEVIKKEYHLK